jgi:hypothetical protein
VYRLRTRPKTSDGVSVPEGKRGRGRPRREDYLSPAAAADWLTERGYPISWRTVQRECDRGRLPHTKTPGGYRRVLIDDLEDYLRATIDTSHTGA